MAKPPMPMRTIPEPVQPLPEEEKNYPGNGIHGFVPGNVDDHQKGNLGWGGYPEVENFPNDPAGYNPLKKIKKGK